MFDDLQRRVNEFARHVGLPVSLTTADLDSIVFSPHSGLIIDAVRSESLLSRGTEEWVVRWFRQAGVGSSLSPTFVPGIPEKAAMSRWVLPVHSGGLILGYLCILDPDAKCDAEMLEALTVQAMDIGRIMLDSEESARLAKDRLRRALTSHGREQADAVNELWEQLGTRVHEWVIAVGTTVAPFPEEPAKRISAATPRGSRATDLLTVEYKFEDHHAFLLAADSDMDPNVLADHTPCCPVLVIGAGAPVQDPHQLPRSYQQALGSLRTAVADSPTPGGIVRWSQLGPIKVMALQQPDILADSVLESIAALRSETELLETVDHYLDHGRKPDLVADFLHIHRGTLYYRLRKFEDATGLNLESGKDRLTIQLSLEALKLLRAPKWHHAQ
ncbi:PucR family transcriptional regulator [Paenarthrobacter sp. NPDC056912]|uniref:PucR family transcriptional regulator n=1 Tax=Paenarthrobacter sp. NPDC056912 TaxID=3345965 RepID=UPI00366D7ECC